MPDTIKKVLVANRGEIALRIFRTLRSMEISCVAIYAEADARAVHARGADQGLKLQGKGLSETYLNGEQVIALALQAGADAIHPGYGFLSESEGFARAVKDAGLVFIGPGEEAIRLMGNKAGARRLAAGIGIPTIEGATGAAAGLIKEAGRIGFPLLVKAAGGGGGKGMRIVRSADELEEALESTQREARNYFGNGEVYIEKYLDDPRHIEVQVLGDQSGNVISLFERECSVQRRYQKIIEEAPSPGISATLRRQITEAARAIARHIGYSSAGTVEFLVKGKSFYFLEMNTRIQVEHPVTEMITGVDLVREQLLVAMGRDLSYKQEDVSARGHAIEARVYAEDPVRNFQPSPGKVLFYREPGLPGLRIDAAMETGCVVGTDYDPMISKVISHAADRKQAIDLLCRGLERYAIHGIRTNLAFLVELLRSEPFMKGETNTGLVGRLIGTGLGHEPPTEENDELLVAAFLFASRENGPGNAGLWKQLGYWRLMMSPEVLISDRLVKRKLVFDNPSCFRMELAGKQEVYRLIKKESHEMTLEAAGMTHRLLYTQAPDDSVWIQNGANTFRMRYAQRISDRELIGLGHHPVSKEDSMVRAPMHGKVIKITVRESDLVNKGDTLLILESMKMENRIVATTKGKVGSIRVAEGEVVADNTPLVVLSVDF